MPVKYFEVHFIQEPSPESSPAPSHPTLTWLGLLGTLIRNVHGDEPVGRELLLRLANWICENYAKESLGALVANYPWDGSEDKRLSECSLDYCLVPAWNYGINGMTVPGYKPKTTCISLGEAAMDLDFILDPEGTTKGNLGSMNACSCESMCRLEIFWRVHSEVYFILIVVSVFLCFLLKRRMRFNILNHRQSPKRSVQV
ncbi:hypothetical protein DKX38_002252 [Salix brachista]|uniref:Uncharacterized protein n=1 Tax=Salix brachista TaxID=2182728 RepID=A0A5N5NMP8_9ROSI|nr:hypothetical protein DKX38_002252 [Salix brachista]